ncbi:MAG: hypothetical protein Q4Q04_06975, partial [Methanocorpusculum sp.]|nr:hypothetical protein [Methanocorpusculum sp.]
MSIATHYLPPAKEALKNLPRQYNSIMVSPEEFLSLCEKTALRVGEALTSLIGTEYGAEELCM